MLETCKGPFYKQEDTPSMEDTDSGEICEEDLKGGRGVWVGGGWVAMEISLEIFLEKNELSRSRGERKSGQRAEDISVRS